MNRRRFALMGLSLLGGLASPAGGRETGPVHGQLKWDPAFLALSAEEKRPWERWFSQSDRLRQKEIALLAEEVARVRGHRARPAREGISFQVPVKPEAWFAGAEARRIAEALLSWQAPCGGWTKNTAMTRQPRALAQRWSPWGEWGYVATIDNQATTSQIEFLAKVFSAGGSAACRGGVERGLRYLLDAQMPSGGWPQVFPLQGTYHDHITFNDNAMTHVLAQLRQIKNRRAPWAWIDASLRAECAAAVTRGMDCVLRCQVRVNGRATVWCAQHHAITAAPVGGRAYELASLSGSESVGIVQFLMAWGAPSAAVREAVESAVAWFRSSAVDPAALGLKGSHGPQWARFYEIGSNRPLFSDPDGSKRFAFSEVKVKRSSYAWFTEAPAALLSRDYPKWQRRLAAS